MDRRVKIAAATAAAVAIAIPAEGLRQRAYLDPPGLPEPLTLFRSGKLPRRGSLSGRSALPNRPCRSDLYRPLSRAEPAVQNPQRYAVGFSNLRPRPAIWRSSDNSSVESLGFVVGPSAIFWRVSKRVVVALNGQVFCVAGAPRPLIERGEKPPFIAYGDSFPAVVRVRYSSASRVHVFPAPVQASSCHAVRRRIGASRLWRHRASARSAFPGAKIGPRDIAFGAATTSAAPQRTTAWRVAALTKNQPFANCQAGHVNNAMVFHGWEAYHDKRGIGGMLWH